MIKSKTIINARQTIHAHKEREKERKTEPTQLQSIQPIVFRIAIGFAEPADKKKHAQFLMFASTLEYEIDVQPLWRRIEYKIHEMMHFTMSATDRFLNVALYKRFFDAAQRFMLDHFVCVCV